MQRAIAKQAEAERERRARIIVAEGELQSSKALQEAAKRYEDNPIALRIRELQTLTDIAREKNMVIVTPTQVGTYLGETVGLASAVAKKRRSSENEKPEK
jgi:regulator of protease activity HflC (stomatin/prohibitin superfamily)